MAHFIGASTCSLTVNFWHYSRFNIQSSTGIITKRAIERGGKVEKRNEREERKIEEQEIENVSGLGF